MKLSGEELERYARHIVLQDVGGPGQVKLKAAKVLVIGAGGLGTPVLLYLAAAGIGTLGIVARIGGSKTGSAAQTINDLNPHVNVIGHKTRIDASNALDIIGRYDIVADGSDNFATRFLVSDACYLAKKTLVAAAVGQFDGQLSTFKPYLKDAQGVPYPTYRCLHPEAPPEGLVPACEEAGIMGALTGIIGSIQAMEVMKEILAIGDSLAGRLFMYDALSTRAYVTTLSWNPDNPLNGLKPTIKDLSSHR
ncbi:MAG: adenylyltransferase [Alphaproteobacteria bacterium]|nr:MAG: adenylyltransferase [Alphaproteobacteria bacterium]